MAGNFGAIRVSNGLRGSENGVTEATAQVALTLFVTKGCPSNPTTLPPSDGREPAQERMTIIRPRNNLELSLPTPAYNLKTLSLTDGREKCLGQTMFI